MSIYSIYRILDRNGFGSRMDGPILMLFWPVHLGHGLMETYICCCQGVMQ